MARKNENNDVMDMSEALSLLEKKGFKREQVAEWMKEAIKTAYKKICSDALLEVDIQTEGGRFVISMHETRIVADDDKEDYEDYEITLEEASEIDPTYKVGDHIQTPVSMSVFGRTDSNKIKNMLKQKLREAEKMKEYDYFKQLENDIVTGVVERIDPDGRSCIINLNHGQLATLKNKDMIPGETLSAGQEIKVYITSVENELQLPPSKKDQESPDKEPKKKKGTFVRITRREDNFVVRLFESIVPEIKDKGKPGPVEILGIAREAGKRSKIAVFSRDPDKDAIGSCVGKQGLRSRTVSDELGGEKIDIIQYDSNIKHFIANALSPAKVENVDRDVILNEQTHEAFVIVPDDVYSLAIGMKGINTKLASMLVKNVCKTLDKPADWNIKIKKASEQDDVRLNIDEDFIRQDMDQLVSNKGFEDIENQMLAKAEETLEVQEEKEDKEETTPVFVENEISMNANVEQILSELNNTPSLDSMVVVEEIDEDDEDDDDDKDNAYLETLSEYEDYYE